MPPGMNKMQVTAEDFIRAWQTSGCITEVAKKTGLTVSGAYSRCRTMRQQGIPLKKLDRNRVSNESLIALAQSLLNGKDDSNGSRTTSD